MGVEGPIYFFKEDDPEWGWLCQWYASPFHAEDEKVIYKHAEQYALTPPKGPVNTMLTKNLGT